MSRKFIVEIDLGNDSFQPIPNNEVIKILLTVANKVDLNDFKDNSPSFYLFDSNGNKVGHAGVQNETK